MTDPTPDFFDIPGELRNMIYHQFFTDAASATGAGNVTRYLPAPTQQPITNLFLVCREAHHEARSLYLATYFPQQHYALQTRHAIHAFAQLPTAWTNNLHKIDLSGYGAYQGRKLFNPIRIALAQAAQPRFDTPAPLLTAYTHTLSNTDALDPEAAVLALLCPVASFKASMLLDNVPIEVEVRGFADGKIEVGMVGPLGKLDWSFIARMRCSEAWLRPPVDGRLLSACQIRSETVALVVEMAGELTQGVQRNRQGVNVGSVGGGGEYGAAHFGQGLGAYGVGTWWRNLP